MLYTIYIYIYIYNKFNEGKVAWHAATLCNIYVHYTCKILSLWYIFSYYHSEADVLEGLGYSPLCARGSKLFNTSGPTVTAAVRARCDATVTRLTGLATLVARFLIRRAFDGPPPAGLIENATALNEIVYSYILVYVPMHILYVVYVL